MDLSPSSSLDRTAQVKAAPAAGSEPSFALYRRDREALLTALERPCGALVVTPNLDHLRMLDRSAALRRAYAAADVIVNDSRFINRLCLKGRALTLPGSELGPLMLARAPDGAGVMVIGCDDAVKADLAARYPALRFTFAEPSMGFVRRPTERRALVQAALQAAPTLLFLCTGAPQSELLAAQMKRAGVTANMLCCGSTFRFLAGSVQRAPPWTRRLGAEWAWRFLTEPRTRTRYLADAAFLARHAGAFMGLRRAGHARFGRYEIDAA